MISNSSVSRLKLMFTVIVFMISSVTLLLLYSCVSDKCIGKANEQPIPIKTRRNHDGSTGLVRHLSFQSHPIHGQKPTGFSGKIRQSLGEFEKHDFQFNIRGKDVIVPLHIQKTGGTDFVRHLTADLDVRRSCQCKLNKMPRKSCTCGRPNNSGSYWLFTRESNGWRCGEYADWTELTSCIDKFMDDNEGQVTKRRYFYVTYLRHPVTRFLSEFRFVRQGNSWNDDHHVCNGEKWVLTSCFDKYTKNLNIRKFMSCKRNPAVNRQTRMLADLTLVGCYDDQKYTEKERDTILLASAKSNLRKMAFFGLAEFQTKSQFVFESTFDLQFKKNFHQKGKTVGSRILRRMSADIVAEVEKLNHLDVKLYEYAKKLFHSRLKAVQRRHPKSTSRFKLRERSSLSEDDINVEY